MSLFSLMKEVTSIAVKETIRGAYCINYGDQKKDGGHNHTFNKGKDRTQAQKAGDQKRRKP